MITGSKFAAGPPFAGALLLPPGLLQQPQLHLPAGLLAYTAAEDWPAALRGRVTRQFAATDNIGVGLRWEAALAELERLFALPVPFREAVARPSQMPWQRTFAKTIVSRWSTRVGTDASRAKRYGQLSPRRARRLR